MGWLDAMLGWNTIPPQVNLPPVETPVANALQGYVGIVEPSTPDLTIPHNPGNTPILDAGQASMPNTGNIPASAIPDVGQVARETQASQEATTSPWVEDTPHHGNSEGAPAETQLPTVTLPVSFPDIEKARDVGVASPYDSKDNVIHKDPNPPPQIIPDSSTDNTGSSQEGSVVPATTYSVSVEFKQDISLLEKSATTGYNEGKSEVQTAIREAPSEYQVLQQLATDDPNTLKSTLNLSQAAADIADWVEGSLDPLIKFSRATPIGLERLSKISEIDEAALEELHQAKQVRAEALRQVIQNYDPNNTEITVKNLNEINKNYKQAVSKVWARQQVRGTSLDDTPLTISQKFQHTMGMSPEYAANAAKSGHVKALAKGIRKMSFFQGVGVGLSAAGIASDVYEHREDLEYALLITKDGTLIDKLKNLKSNVSKNTWHAIVEDTIDSALLTVDVAASAVLTPAGGAAVGLLILHPLGALLKASYYKKEYGGDVDFGKTFLENLKLGDHNHFVLKSQDPTSMDTYLSSYVPTLQATIEETAWYNPSQGTPKEDRTLPGYAQQVVLQGYLQDIDLTGYVQNVTLNGRVESVTLEGRVEYEDRPVRYVIFGDDVYNPVGNPPPIMFPDTDVTVCSAANGCISFEEPEPDIGLVPCTPADECVSKPDECVSEPELSPNIQLANDVDVFVPPDHNRAYDVAIVTPKTVKGGELVSTDPVWSPEVSDISEYIDDDNVCAPPDLGTPSVLVGPSFYELPERDFAAEPMTIFASVGSVRDIGIVGPNKNQW